MLQEIERLRGWAILAVIAVHTTACFTAINPINLLAASMMIADVTVHFATPMFIFISGYVLYYKYNDNFDLWTFYKKRFFSVALPYIAFSLIYSQFNHHDMFSYAALGRIVAMDDPFHFWFFRALFGLYIFYPQILIAYKRFSPSHVLIGAAITQLAWNVYSIANPFPALEAINVIFYFYLGMYVKDHELHMPIWFAMPMICIQSVVWWQIFYVMGSGMMWLRAVESILWILYNSTAILILYGAAKRIAYFDSWGRYSFGVYIVHVFFLVIGFDVLTSLGLTRQMFMWYPLLFAAIAGGSYISIAILSRMPYAKLVIGRTSRSTN